MDANPMSTFLVIAAVVTVMTTVIWYVISLMEDDVPADAETPLLTEFVPIRHDLPPSPSSGDDDGDASSITDLIPDISGDSGGSDP